MKRLRTVLSAMLLILAAIPAAAVDTPPSKTSGKTPSLAAIDGGFQMLAELMREILGFGEVSRTPEEPQKVPGTIQKIGAGLDPIGAANPDPSDPSTSGGSAPGGG